MSQATDYAGVEEAAGFQPSGVSQSRSTPEANASFQLMLIIL